METIDDIVREMRTLGRLDEKSTDKIPRSLQALGLRTYAKRIKAAHEHETVKDCHALNAAKMREALKQARRVLHCAIVAGILKRKDAHKALNVVATALSAPPRNCDVGTAEEQEVRFSAFCLAHHMQSEKGCAICLCHLPNGCSCEFVWSQMPYESKVKE
jgi:hypothetical protein